MLTQLLTMITTQKFPLQDLADEDTEDDISMAATKEIIIERDREIEMLSERLEAKIEQGWKLMSCSHCQNLCQQAS